MKASEDFTIPIIPVAVGNIFINDDGHERQLTFYGLDRSPFLLNDRKVLFIRMEEAISSGNDKHLPPIKYYTYRLMSVNVKTGFERIIADKKPFEDGLNGTSKILSMRGATLSADQKFLYFVTEKYVTASQFVKVNVESGVWTELFSVESFEIIPSEEKIFFLVAQSEIRNRGRDIYYKLCDESGMVLKEFDSQENMIKYKNSVLH